MTAIGKDHRTGSQQIHIRGRAGELMHCFRAHHVRLRQDDQRDRGGKRSEQVAYSTGKGRQDIVAGNALEISRIERA